MIYVLSYWKHACVCAACLPRQPGVCENFLSNCIYNWLGRVSDGQRRQGRPMQELASPCGSA